MLNVSHYEATSFQLWTVVFHLPSHPVIQTYRQLHASYIISVSNSLSNTTQLVFHGEASVSCQRHPLVLRELPAHRLRGLCFGSLRSQQSCRSMEPEGSHIWQPVPTLRPALTICLGHPVRALPLTRDVLWAFFFSLLHKWLSLLLSNVRIIHLSWPWVHRLVHHFKW